MTKRKWDGHTHTKFCRHGNDAETDAYLQRAIALGFERYTLTEHPPLPENWVNDPGLMRELAMDAAELQAYLSYAEQKKREYAGRIEVTVGLEFDYLYGKEDFSDALLDRCGDRLEDAVVSVHYLPGTGGMRCIDFTPEDFREGLLDYYGSMEKVVDEYFNHVEMAIAWAARLPMRKRLGHVRLIEKFRQALPAIDEEQVEERLDALVPQLQAANVGVDVNTAGLRVPTCGRPYADERFLRKCAEAGIVCVYGSDSHKPEQVGIGWDWYEQAPGTPDAACGN